MDDLPWDYDGVFDDDAGDIWRTRDGRLLLIKDMDDKHLENTIRYLRARGVRTEEEVLISPIAKTEAALTQHPDALRDKLAYMEREKARRAKLLASNRTQP